MMKVVDHQHDQSLIGDLTKRFKFVKSLHQYLPTKIP